MNNDPNELAAFEQLLAAGFPAWQVVDQVTKHLRGLEALPPDTPERDAAIGRAKAFIERIPPLERVPAAGSA